MSENIKFHYFKANARGGLTRPNLYSQKVKFEDHQFGFEEWQILKVSDLFVYGQAPVLEMNGKKYVQSQAIEQLLGKKYKLIGKGIEDEYQIESLLCSYEDIFSQLHNVWPENDENKKNF